ncbi:sarcosine oxidase subunit gamma [Mesorhizobium sp.]|uniref:sarcosine oxidase subunit gamma n=1 Tax=Mesorhizobium sp. TaxID=1871066 RepID=UPI000FE4B949|nr:sarcosine oxidase subunit gamma [Mesorhizobium sp.]RWB66290.1 MAG: sarcosine oxidase subunit gamma [Mesorhizobium sp.]
MPDLKPVTALGGNDARCVTHGALTLEENVSLALASLALRRGCRQPTPFGLRLPGPGLWVTGGSAAALWIGRDQWLIEGPGQAEEDFAVKVAAQCLGCSLTEQTHGFVAFEICSSAGEAPIHAIMARLINLDPSRLRPGAASRTGLDHMGAFVIRRAPDCLAILGIRSAAGSLWHALETAASRLPEFDIRSRRA